MRTEPTGAVRAAILALSLGLLAACAEARHGRADAAGAAPSATPGTAEGVGVNAVPARPGQLEHSSWRLVGGLPDVDATAVEITLSFGAAGAGDGRSLPISGSGGCNGYSGTMQFDGDDGAASVGPVAATKRGCAPPAGPAEADWFDALSQLESVQLQGERLQLVLADGTRVQLERR